MLSAFVWSIKMFAWLLTLTYLRSIRMMLVITMIKISYSLINNLKARGENKLIMVKHYFI